MASKVLVTPFQKFDKAQSLGGILLLGATLLAIILANTPLVDFYEGLRQTRLVIGVHNIELSKPLILWINDGLMAIFFFLIGLEIKRELMIGELKSPGKAALPLFAAVGGMAVPVALFFILNMNPQASNGWGIPMATDIAFSLAILKLLGKRVPIGLKIFLTAFAIIDDIGAVLVIALFYSSSVDWMKIVYAAIPLSLLFFLAYRNYFPKYFHLLCGIVIWYLFLKSGIHPTIAGVLLAFTVPISQKTDIKTYAGKLCEIADDIRDTRSSDHPILTGEQIEHIDDLEEWTGKVQSPLQHLEHILQSWVAYFIMPVFAFFNAGVIISMTVEPDTGLIAALAFSLFFGKSIGVTLFSLAAVKFGLASLPEGVSASQIAGVSLLAGVGFTMSIFIANLAFADAPMLMDSSKMGILAGSLVSGVAGYLVLRRSKGSDDRKVRQ
ncbi:MAG: Na+/H+ antiporter NhaA [Bacteroidales bacterium]|jgi:NhaA family Na+:H+ antiporter|nr:Na+/H+ antiporter NhaA [Bacteroidales bacterium]MCU0410546.1 Na+/H+ antiporter NhaA [Bacteroidales bacterium]